MVVHVHTHLTIFVNGQARVIPYGVGIPGFQAVETSAGPFVETGSCFYWLHVHADDGIIHIESPSTTMSFTLGQFFDEWGVPLSTTQVGPATGNVTVFFTPPGKKAASTPATPATSHWATTTRSSSTWGRRSWRLCRSPTGAGCRLLRGCHAGPPRGRCARCYPTFHRAVDSALWSPPSSAAKIAGA